MKVLLTFFSVILMAGHVGAQTSTNLGSGLNNPGAGLGNGVGTPAAPIGSSATPNPTPTPNNQIDNSSTLSTPIEEQQQMEDTSNFNQGVYGGALGSGGTSSQPSGALPSGSGMGVGNGVGTGRGTGSGVGSPPPMANPNEPLP